MNTKDYVREGLRQLSDTQYYTEIDYDPTESFITQINTLSNKMLEKGHISLKTHTILYVTTARLPYFYMLPKIHKKHVPGRPILSANGSPTEKLSAFIDSYLNKLVPKLDSYVKDTKHLIQIIESIPRLPENSILVSFDVTSLYTNIPHIDALQSATRALLKDGSLDSDFIQLLIQGLKLVLELNAFQFNHRIFLQTKGTAMGTRVAPSSACFTMGDIDQKILDYQSQTSYLSSGHMVCHLDTWSRKTGHFHRWNQ